MLRLFHFQVTLTTFLKICITSYTSNGPAPPLQDCNIYTVIIIIVRRAIREGKFVSFTDRSSGGLNDVIFLFRECLISAFMR